MFPLLCFLNMFQVLFKVEQLVKNTTQRPALLWGAECVGQYVQVPRTGDTSKVLGRHPWTNAESWKTSKMFEKIMLSLWQFLRHKSLQCSGACPTPTHPVQHCSVPSRGKGCLWIRWPNDRHCSHSNTRDRHCSYSTQSRAQRTYLWPRLSQSPMVVALLW